MPIYAWGSNGSGQLGIGHLEDVSHPTLCVESPAADQGEVRALAAGGNHTLILSKSSCLGVIGQPSDIARKTIFKNVGMCSATWDASFFLVKPNQLISFGTGERGELGCGPELRQTLEANTPINLSEVKSADTHVVDIASGVQHSVAVLSNGEVIGWGNGRKGQLGQPADVVWKPRRISDIGFKVQKAVCGQGFTFLVGDPIDGECLVLGQDKFGVITNAPKSIPGWKDVGASWGSLFVLLKDGHLVSWGRDDHGQLASSDLPKIEQIAIGSEHGLALSKDNKLYAWGWGEHGNCGRDIDKAGDVRGAREIELPAEIGRIQGIGAGCATSWLWT